MKWWSGTDNRYLWAVLLLTLLISSCSDGDHAGGATDIGHSVAGVIVDSSGAPVAGVHVTVLRQSESSLYATDSLSTSTQSDGTFQFETSDPGQWVVRAEWNGYGSIQAWSSDQDSLPLQMILGRMTVLRGRLSVSNPNHQRLAVLGSQSNTARPAENGDYLLDGIPPGKFSLCLASTEGTISACATLQTQGVHDTLDLLDLESRSTGILQPAEWSMDSLPRHYLGRDFSSVLYTDSAASNYWSSPLSVAWDGAEPDQDLAGFTLPIVLRAPAIDFSRLHSDGSDVHILDSAGRLLPMEIASWDKAQERALLWVRIPTIAANSSAISLWVSGGDTFQAPGGSVFLNADGILGAYHLENQSTDPGASVIDVVDMPHYGTTSARTAGTTTFLGDALLLDGPADFVSTGKQDPCNGDCTLSLWVYANGFASGKHTLFCQFDQDSSTAWQLDYNTSLSAVTLWNSSGQSVVFLNSSVAPGSQWHQVSLIRNSTAGSVSLYMDGTPRDTGRLYQHIGSDELSFAFGSSPKGDPWIGGIDEIRTEWVARTPAWIALSYRTQADAAAAFAP